MNTGSEALMKKAIIFLIVSMTSILLCFSVFSFASEEDAIKKGVWGELTWEFNENTGKLTVYGEGPMDDFNSSTQKAWRVYAPYIRTAEIKDGVTRIGISAFAQCSELVSVSISKSVTSIGAGAFTDCVSLTDITLPDGLTSLENNIFSGCTDLKELIIPKTVEKIGVWAFKNCESLESICL